MRGSIVAVLARSLCSEKVTTIEGVRGPVIYPRASIALVVLLWSLFGVQFAQAQTKIDVFYPGPIGPTALLLPIAQEQGLFAKHGLDAKLTRAGASGFAKRGQIGLYGAPAILRQLGQGRDLRFLGALGNWRSTFHLVTRAEIRDPQALRGKRFGVFGIGAANWINVIKLLEHLRLEPKADNISILQVGNQNRIAQALEAGTIDAALLYPAQSAKLKTRGFVVLVDMYTLNMYFAGGGIIVTTSDYLQEHPDVIEKFILSLMEAVAFSLGPMNKSTVLDTITKYYDLTDSEAAEAGYKNLHEVLNRKPYVSVQHLKSIQEVMGLAVPSVLSINVADVIEERFVRGLDESGRLDRLYDTYGVK